MVRLWGRRRRKGCVPGNRWSCAGHPHPHRHLPASASSSTKWAGKRRREGRARRTSQRVERAALPAASYLIREGIEARAHGVAAAELGGFEATDDVLECSGHYKVLLL